MNVRREYATLSMYQAGSANRVDLTNTFFIGTQQLPPFGQMTELILPWDQKLESELVIEFSVAPPQMNVHHHPHYDMGMGMGHPHHHHPHHAHHHQPPNNPYSYAIFSVAGFLFKQ